MNLFCEPRMRVLTRGETDMDNSNPSHVPSRRIHKRKIHPLARRRILRLHRRNPTLQNRRRVNNLRNRRLRRENRLLRQRTRRHSRFQLQDPRLGEGDTECYRGQRRRCDYRFCGRELFPGEYGCCGEGCAYC